MGLLALLAFACPRSQAEGSHFILRGEIRERGLYSHGYNGILRPDDHGVFWVGQRTRLILDYTHKNMGFFVQLEDGRIWGSSGSAHNPGFGVGQAWFFAEFAQRFQVKVGRMPLVYEDGRYMAYSLWDECGNSNDALKLRYRSLDERTRVELVGSVSNNSDSRILNPYHLEFFYKYLLVAYVSHTFTPDFRWSVLSVTDFREKHYQVFDSTQNGTVTKVDPTKIYARSAVGTYLDICRHRKFSALIYAYGQFGKDNYGRKIVAGMASVILSYKPHPIVELKAAYDYISGNKDAGPDFPLHATDHSFSRFMGSSHSFLGIMDLFSGSGRHDITLGSGYHQPYLTLDCHPTQEHSISLNARYFWAANTIKEVQSKDLGLEMALVYKYHIRPDVFLHCGYAIHSRSQALETLSGIESGKSKLPHYGYVMISYTPVIYNSANHPKKEK